MEIFAIANWKMQLNEAESMSLAKEVVRLWAGQGAEVSELKVVLCPSHVSLNEVSEAIHGTPIELGAQDVFWEDRGAFTGEVSPVTLKERGCRYCIVGHSERRQYLSETDEMVRHKVAALMRHDINPVLCVGETFEEREAGRRDAVVIGQVRAALEDIRPVGNQRLIIAYEPRWVIGTGTAVQPDDAASMHYLINETLRELYPEDVVERQCAVIYGGSVDSGNVKDFIASPVIQGVLVGGAALKAAEFVRMLEVAADASRA
ncbi:hypothetical protein AMJ57_00175 [Parcubacteria bacterium SG8_24]|nr:MAG: hypothetical protein AMJ57_00175 [Parcubacteria bacterium SG8_24]